MNYQETFESKADQDRLYEEWRFLAEQGQIELEAGVKEHRKICKRNGTDVQQPWVDGLVEQIKARYPFDQRYAEYEMAKQAREDELERLAPMVCFEPQGGWTTVKRAYRRSHTSQTQPELYSRGSLLFLADKLEHIDIPCKITEDQDFFSLEARCPLWMADAAERLIKVQDMRDTCKRHGTNVRVYLPGLRWIDGEC